MEAFDIAIIGAGLAGLSAARKLAETDARVVVLEKSRGLGGRAATRRIDGIPVDHGAQFFTARSETFQSQTQAWQESGVCRVWSHGFHRAIDGRITAPDPRDAHPRYACPEGMTALAKHLAMEIDIRRSTRALGIYQRGKDFEIECDNGLAIRCRHLLLTAPLGQALELVDPLLSDVDRIKLATEPMHPCFAILAENLGPVPEWKGLVIVNGALTWIGADFTKRPEKAGPRWMVLHASGEFTRAHYADPITEVAERLIAEAARIDPANLGQLNFRDSHRWRYARVVQSLVGSCYRSESGLYFAGDAFGSTLESAWCSGRAAAELLLSNQTN